MEHDGNVGLQVGTMNFEDIASNIFCIIVERYTSFRSSSLPSQQARMEGTHNDGTTIHEKHGPGHGAFLRRVPPWSSPSRPNGTKTGQC